MFSRPQVSDQHGIQAHRRQAGFQEPGRDDGAVFRHADRNCLLPYGRSGPALDAKGHPAFNRRQGVVAGPDSEGIPGVLYRRDDRPAGPPHGIPACLGRAVIIHEAPACRRPAVIVHPEQQSGAIPLPAPGGLHGMAHPFVLDMFEMPHALFKVIGRAEEFFRRHPLGIEQARVAVRIVFRMIVPHRSGGIGEIFSRHEPAQGEHARRPDCARFAVEAAHGVVNPGPVMFPVHFHDPAASGHGGSVDIADRHAGVSAAAERAGWEKRAPRVQFAQCGRRDFPDDLVPPAVPGVPVEIHSVLVVPAPPCQRRVVAKHADGGGNLPAYFGSELGIVLGIPRARHLEILADQDAHAVAAIPKGVRLVYAAAPSPQAIDAAIARQAQEPLVPAASHPGWPRIARHPVAAAAEDALPVHADYEAAARRIAVAGLERLVNDAQFAGARLLGAARRVILLLELQRANAKPQFPRIKNGPVPGGQRAPQGVKRLPAAAVRPPEFWRFQARAP